MNHALLCSDVAGGVAVHQKPAHLTGKVWVCAFSAAELQYIAAGRNASVVPGHVRKILSVGMGRSYWGCTRC